LIRLAQGILRGQIAVMRKSLKFMPRNVATALAALALAGSAMGAETAANPTTPGEIRRAAPAGDWVTIAPSDLLVMTLAPDADAKPRRLVIQLLPAPFSQGWIGNIRRLVALHWWDTSAVYRVQDNFVAQFGDPDEDTPKAKPLPAGLAVVPQSAYTYDFPTPDAARHFLGMLFSPSDRFGREARRKISDQALAQANGKAVPDLFEMLSDVQRADSYAPNTAFFKGIPIAVSGTRAWPTHCYGTIGVGRNNSPDTGTGAELYAVIGTPPRQLDRNIAVVGRVIEGMEYLSGLPRGPAPMGMYNDKAKNTPILSIRLASELPEGAQPRLQYLSTESASFAAYVHARVNRRDAFYIYASGSADICNIPVPIRPAP
jgi:peptidylprolyl isomerase